MLWRKTTGSVVCPSCGSLVGVNDERCYSCGRANPGMWGFAPVLRQFGNDLGFVPLVIGGSAVLYALTLLASGRGLQIMGGGFNILAPSAPALLAFGASGGYPVFQLGSWWTVLSATWLHGSLLHIVFNMMWVRDIGPSTADVIGPGRTIIIYVVSGVCGFLLSSVAGFYLPPLPLLRGAQLTVGASASIFGLLGALVHYGRKSGSSYIHTQAKQWALLMFVYGLIMPGIDNFAHAGGFIGGYITSAFFNPLTREKGDHLLIAAVLLILTFAAIAMSVVEGWPYLTM
ncbi:MAG TPA: rhomboid family intramembrane serine protease [Vicinamibacterales bacterium]|nr:rhomboid family intramembrane serine protease [Vicinamibacterales bacterium]